MFGATWAEVVDGAITTGVAALVLAMVGALIAGARATWKLPQRMEAIEADLAGLRHDLKDHMDSEIVEREAISKETSGQISSVHRRIDTLILAHRGDFTRGEPVE